MASVPPSGRADGRRERRPALDRLLADLGASIRRGPPPSEHGSDPSDFSSPPNGPNGPAADARPRPRLATGLPEIDGLLRGGLPLGRLTEIHGPASSGRTSLVLSLVSGVTRRGECAAVVDRADALDPVSARAAGVDLARLLWARAPGRSEALRCAARLLETEGFPLVVLDLGDAPDASTAGDTAWLRLSRQAAATRTALVLVTAQRTAGSYAEVALEMQLERAHFEGAPALLEGLATRAVLVRHRAAPTGCATPVRWRVGAAA